MPLTPYPSVRFNYTSTSEVENIIKALKPKDAKGYDEIPIKVLKWCTPFISSPMTYIFNKSIQKGTFPSRLKYSTIIPIYKSGDKLDMSNFRPISILICISKILEKNFIQQNLLPHCHKQYIDKGSIWLQNQYVY
jgi:hypothetical protein